MSLFSVVKTVMDTNGWPQPITSVASSQDPNMRQGMALANKVLSSVSYKKDWPVLIREHKFATVGNEGAYELPADFHHIVSPSAVDEDHYYNLRGSLTPLQWYRKVLNGSVDWGSGFRIDQYGKKFMVAPVPSSPDNLVFMYVTNLIAKNDAGDPIAQYVQDTDVSMIDEDLIELGLSWRWRQKKGLDYTAEMAEFSGTMRERFAQYIAIGELPVGGYRYNQAPLTDGSLPDVFGV